VPFVPHKPTLSLTKKLSLMKVFGATFFQKGGKIKPNTN
jgi:hypothetical protein